MDVWGVRGAGYAARVLVVSVLWEREGDVVDVRAWSGGWRVEGGGVLSLVVLSTINIAIVTATECLVSLD